MTPISNLNLLDFLFNPSPFLILFDMQAVYTELIEFVFIFFLISENALLLLYFW